jgi:hypothetical protein
MQGSRCKNGYNDVCLVEQYGRSNDLPIRAMFSIESLASIYRKFKSVFC